MVDFQVQLTNSQPFSGENQGAIHGEARIEVSSLSTVGGVFVWKLAYKMGPKSSSYKYGYHSTSRGDSSSYPFIYN